MGYRDSRREHQNFQHSLSTALFYSLEKFNSVSDLSVEIKRAIRLILDSKVSHPKRTNDKHVLIA